MLLPGGIIHETHERLAGTDWQHVVIAFPLDVHLYIAGIAFFVAQWGILSSSFPTHVVDLHPALHRMLSDYVHRMRETLGFTVNETGIASLTDYWTSESSTWSPAYRIPAGSLQSALSALLLKYIIAHNARLVVPRDVHRRVNRNGPNYNTLRQQLNEFKSARLQRWWPNAFTLTDELRELFKSETVTAEQAENLTPTAGFVEVDRNIITAQIRDFIDVMRPHVENAMADELDPDTDAWDPFLIRLGAVLYEPDLRLELSNWITRVFNWPSSPSTENYDYSNSLYYTYEAIPPLRYSDSRPDDEDYRRHFPHVYYECSPGPGRWTSPFDGLADDHKVFNPLKFALRHNPATPRVYAIYEAPYADRLPSEQRTADLPATPTRWSMSPSLGPADVDGAPASPPLHPRGYRILRTRRRTLKPVRSRVEGWNATRRLYYAHSIADALRQHTSSTPPDSTSAGLTATGAAAVPTATVTVKMATVTAAVAPDDEMSNADAIWGSDDEMPTAPTSAAEDPPPPDDTGVPSDRPTSPFPWYCGPLPIPRNGLLFVETADFAYSPYSAQGTPYCWIEFALTSPAHQTIIVPRASLFDDVSFAQSFHMYDWSRLSPSHCVNAQYLARLADELRDTPVVLNTSAGLALELARSQVILTRLAFVMNTLGRPAYDALLYSSLDCVHAQRSRYYVDIILRGDRGLTQAWPILIQYLRKTAPFFRSSLAYETLGPYMDPREITVAQLTLDPGLETDEGAGGVTFGTFTTAHITSCSKRNGARGIRGDLYTQGLGYTDTGTDSARPSPATSPFFWVAAGRLPRTHPPRLALAGARVKRPFTPEWLLKPAPSLVKAMCRKKVNTANLQAPDLHPMATVFKATSTVDPPHFAALQLATHSLLARPGEQFDPHEADLFPSSPSGLAVRLVDPKKALDKRLADARICVRLQVGALIPGQRVKTMRTVLALVDTGAAADVMDGSIADTIEGLQYSNQAPVLLTGFGDNMNAYARVAFVTFKIGNVYIARKILVVAKGLMGDTPMLLGLSTLTALRASISLDTANSGMTILPPGDHTATPYFVPFTQRASPTGARWSVLRKRLRCPLARPWYDATSPRMIRRRVRTRLTWRSHRRRSSSRKPEMITLTKSTFLHLINSISTLTDELASWRSGTLTAQTPSAALSPAEKAAKATIEQLLKDGLIEPSQAGYGSPVVLAPKKDGTMRFCVDYRRLNNLIEGDVFPLPRIDDQLERLQGSSIFSVGDCLSGFWQLGLEEASRDYTTFLLPWGAWKWVCTPFGLKSAPSAFCRAVSSVLGDLLSTCVVAYVDDLTLHSPTVAQHLIDLEAFFAALARGNLKLKPSKCHFMVREIDLLGHRVSAQGVRMDTKKVEVISKITERELQTVEHMRSFLGMTGFYRRFIRNYTRRELPLRDLIHAAKLADTTQLQWTPEASEALADLKKVMCDDIVLMLPDFSKPFIIYTDWSLRAMGAALMQTDSDGRERPIAFISRTLTATEARYSSPTEGECIAVMWAVKTWRHYFDCGHPFTIRTDHSPLQWLKSQELLANKALSRAALVMQGFNYTIEYRPGSTNVVADFESRMARTHPIYEPGAADGSDLTTDLPNGAHGHSVPRSGDPDDPTEIYGTLVP
eukprot:tig00000448_g843.t1